MAIAYRYIDGGFLEQQDGDGSWSVHTLTGPEKAMFDANTPQYADLVQANADRTGLAPAAIWAIGFGETGWKQPASASFDGGHGLMQITASNLKQGLPDSEVDKPENNIKLGADYLRTLAAKYGNDIVKMASGYNCGSAKSNSAAPWGLCEYKIPSTGAYPYISKVVRAYNYALGNAPTSGGLGPNPSTNLDWLKGIGGPVGVGVVVGLGWWLVKSGMLKRWFA